MKATIAVLPGDGIGPEITHQATHVLQAIAKKHNHQFTFRKGLIGGSAIDQAGNPFPEETFKLCFESDAILLGSIGDPKFDNDPSARVRPEQGILQMRKTLGLYGNVRPIKVFEPIIDNSPIKKIVIEDADFVVVRELIGGIYFGHPRGRSEDENSAFDTATYTRDEIERVLHFAFDLAKKRNKKVTLVDKANVLATSRLWRQIGQEFEMLYPDIEVEYMFVDNASMQLIKKPRHFDVIVTENLFGDILTDEASVITGSIGMLPSASIGVETSVYEPIHGSYPKATGTNTANPIGTILSAALMLEYSFNLTEESQHIYDAVNTSLAKGIGTKDIFPKKPVSTSDVGTYIAELLLA